MKKENMIKKRVGLMFLILFILIVIAEFAFICFYFTRFQTIGSIRKLTDYKDGYNLYRMDVKYDYSLDEIIASGIVDDQTMVEAIAKVALPLLPVQLKAPNFGCTAFCITDTNQDVLMGRNYDFRNDTSAMLVHCAPKDGYESVGFAALDNVSANVPDESLKKKFTALTAPFICLDGMNEKGVSIAVLTLDSVPVFQHTGKPVISTTLAIRLVLDHAATTEEAVELLGSYDMFASGGRDYHFYITDATGDSRVVEYDCESRSRELAATPIRTITNFYGLYIDKVLPNQRNGIYGHGRERYDAVEEILNKEADFYTVDTAWEGLRATQQLLNPEDVTSNTQWSIVYNDTDLSAQIVLRRHWKDMTKYDLISNTVQNIKYP